VHVTADQLLDVKSTPGSVTEDGLRSNINVGIRYLETWLRGTGAVGINNMMEDAATAEISRSQVWQWLHNDVELDDGQTVTRGLVERLVEEEMAGIRESVGDDAFAKGRWDDARTLFTDMALSDDYEDFLTLPAYERMP
jgi:malate synthase